MLNVSVRSDKSCVKRNVLDYKVVYVYVYLGSVWTFSQHVLRDKIGLLNSFGFVDSYF